MRVLVAVLLVGIAGCGGSSPPGGGAVSTLEDSEEKVDKSPAQAADKQKPTAKKSVESRETLTLKGHSEIVYSVSFSPDGKRIVSGGGYRTAVFAGLRGVAKVWDISSLATSK